MDTQQHDGPMMLDEENQISSPDGQDMSEGGSDGEQLQTGGEPSQSAPVHEPPSDPYAGTRMQGRSPEEIRAYMRLMEQTVMEQSQKLTQLEQNMKQPQQAPQDDDVDFFENPREVIRRELQQMISPINEQINNFRVQAQVNNAWSAAKAEFPDLDKYRPLIERMIEGRGMTPSDITPDIMRSLYYTAVGYIARHGESGPPQVSPQPARPQVIPQHRPSSPPLPSQGGGPTQRKLTEQERRLVREWGMSEAEYLNLQGADSDLIGFGGKNE